MHIDSVETYVDDVVNHVEKIQSQFPNIQCILMGHSMVSVCDVGLSSVR